MSGRCLRVSKGVRKCPRECPGVLGVGTEGVPGVLRDAQECPGVLGVESRGVLGCPEVSRGSWGDVQGCPRGSWGVRKCPGECPGVLGVGTEGVQGVQECPEGVQRCSGVLGLESRGCPGVSRGCPGVCKGCPEMSKDGQRCPGRGTESAQRYPNVSRSVQGCPKVSWGTQGVFRSAWRGVQMCPGVPGCLQVSLSPLPMLVLPPPGAAGPGGAPRGAPSPLLVGAHGKEEEERDPGEGGQRFGGPRSWGAPAVGCPRSWGVPGPGVWGPLAFGVSLLPASPVPGVPLL